MDPIRNISEFLHLIILLRSYKEHSTTIDNLS